MISRNIYTPGVEYLETNTKLFSGQHAYRKFHSTTTCLIEISEILHSNIDRGRVCGIASMDLGKAFDSVSHSLLLSKLSALGFEECSLKWKRSY